MKNEMETNYMPRVRSEVPLHASERQVPQNVDWPERYASIAVGVNMIYSGLSGIGKKPVRNLITSLAGGYLLYRGLTGNCPLYTSWGKNGKNDLNINIKERFIVDRPREEVYAFWRQLENLPLFMSHLKEVRQLDGKRSHWEANLPGNVATVSWDAEIVKEHENELIGWQSIPNSMIENAGKVEFFDALGGKGTELRVVISYRPPAGVLGAGVAKLFNPLFSRIVKEDVNNFRKYIETSALVETPDPSWRSDQASDYSA